ncbi:MAG: DUF4254 domain-containing protein [Bacteroidota bacterium]|nr:DUF4254 domain-containing protein [Bacteroidota bacterium]|tara:strand:- start:1670 stop:2275 length:606 start_codon:yes stop_codon:yes gene_type:complete
MISNKAFKIFEMAINDYHIKDDVNQPMKNPFDKESLEYLLYKKNWIDTVQWHYEDLIRDPKISPNNALSLKRKIDSSNQDRTDTVEYIDSFYYSKFKNVEINKNASINTESPAWAIDRLSILALKIFHMKEESERSSGSKEHRDSCKKKLLILMEQKNDLSKAIDQLLQDMKNGLKYMKVYKQMKMYNDESLNPVLYQNNI